MSESMSRFVREARQQRHPNFKTETKRATQSVAALSR